MRIFWLVPVACAWLGACSGEKPPKTAAEVLSEARLVLRNDPRLAAAMILEAPPEVQGDPEVHELLQTAQRQATMTPKARKQDDFNHAADDYLGMLDKLARGSVQTIEGTADAARLFSSASLLLRQEDLIGLDKASKGKAAKLKTLLVARQKALFPAMRKTYAGAMAADAGVSAAGVDITAGGAGAKTLRVVSSAFYSADAIQRTHEALMGRATRLRFTRAEYQPYGGGVTSYKINGRADDEIAY